MEPFYQPLSHHLHMCFIFIQEVFLCGCRLLQFSASQSSHVNYLERFFVWNEADERFWFHAQPVE